MRAAILHRNPVPTLPMVFLPDMIAVMTSKIPTATHAVKILNAVAAVWDSA